MAALNGDVAMPFAPLPTRLWRLPSAVCPAPVHGASRWTFWLYIAICCALALLAASACVCAASCAPLEEMTLPRMAPPAAIAAPHGMVSLRHSSWLVAPPAFPVRRHGRLRHPGRCDLSFPPRDETALIESMRNRYRTPPVPPRFVA